MIYHHGGSFTIEGKKYTETISYANESTRNLIGKPLVSTLEVDGDTLVLRGINNQYNERWVRIKP